MTKQMPLILIALFLVLVTGKTNAQPAVKLFSEDVPAPLTPRFIKDLDPSTGQLGTGDPLVAANNKLFFRNSTVNADWGFWASDGTQAGTVKLKNAYPFDLVATATYAFAFFSGDGIWVSDGSVAGTRKLNFPAAQQLSQPQTCIGPSPAKPTATGSYLFLFGSELWRTDGTDEGTIKLGSLATEICAATAVNGRFFFNQQNQLWQSDGTVAGTTLVATIPTDSPSDNAINSFTSSGDNLFFIGPQSTLWVSDGTELGTIPLKTLPSNVPLIPGNGNIYFVLNNTELWRSSGTGASTTLITTVTESIYPRRHFFYHNKLYIAAESGLWVSDGSDAGTQKIAEGSYPSIAYPTRFAGWGSHVYFMWSPSEDNYELWQSDGTAAGTQQVADINPGAQSSYPGELFVYQNQLYFFASRLRDRELWRSDGTAAGTVLAADVNTGGLGSEPHDFMRLNERQFVFLANSPERDNVLWISDGSAAGTKPILAEEEVAYVGSIREIFTHDETIYFAAGGITNASASQLWQSDGTPSGTKLVIDLRELNPPVTSALRNLFWFNDKLYFVAGRLWQSDGTAEGTQLAVPSQNLRVEGVGVNDHLLFFVANNATSGKVEVWRSDGTEGGSYPVWTKPNGVFSNPKQLTPFGDWLLFMADDGTQGMELWRSDGTEAGTMLVHDLTPGAASSSVSTIVADAHWAYLIAANGAELWRSDGTAVNTTPMTIPTNCNAATYTNLALEENRLFVTVKCQAGPVQLWVSDGSQAGTTLLYTRSEDPQFDQITFAGSGLGYLFFNVTNRRQYPERAELWFSNGTVDGTMLVHDFTPEKLAFPTIPHDLQAINGNIYLAAYGGYEKGVELWAIGSPRHHVYLPVITSSP